LRVQFRLTQINITFNAANRRMSTKYLVVSAALAVMLIAATAAATDSVYADYKRKHNGKKSGFHKSQAVSQANNCGTGEVEPIDVFCQNIASQT
jgi:hypothetical protein